MCFIDEVSDEVSRVYYIQRVYILLYNIYIYICILCLHVFQRNDGPCNISNNATKDQKFQVQRAPRHVREGYPVNTSKKSKRFDYMEIHIHIYFFFFGKAFKASAWHLPKGLATMSKHLGLIHWHLAPRFHVLPTPWNPDSTH